MQLLTGFYVNPIHNSEAVYIKYIEVYGHVGNSVLNLLDLLLYCNKQNINMKQFIINVLRTSYNILGNVTIEIFGSWAKVGEII